MTRGELLQLLVLREDSESSWEGTSGPVRLYLDHTNGFYHMKVYLGKSIFLSAGPRRELEEILEDTIQIVEGRGPTSNIFPGDLREVADWLERNRSLGVPAKSAFERL
jgi:hypothetical protein